MTTRRRARTTDPSTPQPPRSAGRMSFALTTQQMYAREKTVTRRTGWLRVREGDIITAVEKCQGIPKGGHQIIIGRLRATSVRRERLSRMISDDAYGRRECVLEGFDWLTPVQFVAMFCKANGVEDPDDLITRIEFVHLEETA